MVQIRVAGFTGNAQAQTGDLVLLAQGSWSAKNLVVNQLVTDKEMVSLSAEENAVIQKNWDYMLKKNPNAFAGPTLRCAGVRQLGNKLIVDLLPADYRQSMTIGWIGCAMLPITSDGYLAMQAPVASIAASVGGGIRVPGCTPPHSRFVEHLIKEMEEEFAVQAGWEQITVLGLMEIHPPVAKFHHGLVVAVRLPMTFTELKRRWETAEDKWEGEIQPLLLSDFDAVYRAIFVSNDYAVSSRLSIALAHNFLTDSDTFLLR